MTRALQSLMLPILACLCSAAISRAALLPPGFVVQHAPVSSSVITQVMIDTNLVAVGVPGAKLTLVNRTNANDITLGSATPLSVPDNAGRTFDLQAGLVVVLPFILRRCTRQTDSFNTR